MLLLHKRSLLLASIAILAILVGSSLAASLAGPQQPIYSSSSQLQQTKQANLSPTDDAYVVADLNDPQDIEGLRTLNTVNEPFLKVWYAWNLTSSSAEGNLSNVKIVSLAYLKFNFDSLHAKSIVSATLNLYAYVVNLTGSSRDLVAYYVTNNTWSQDTLDFDNAPAFNNGTFATSSVSANDQWYSFNLTGMIQNNQTSGELSVAIAFLLLYYHSQEQVVFDSTRASTDQPYLSVSYIGQSSSSVGIWSAIVSFVGSSPWIYIIPTVAVIAGAGGAFLFFYSRRNGHSHVNFTKSKKPPSSPSTSVSESHSRAQSTSSAEGAPLSVATAGSVIANNLSSTISCPNCSKQIQSDYSLCPYCGFVFPSHCPQCGKAVKKDFTRCPYCGTRFANPQNHMP